MFNLIPDMIIIAGEAELAILQEHLDPQPTRGVQGTQLISVDPCFSDFLRFSQISDDLRSHLGAETCGNMYERCTVDHL